MLRRLTLAGLLALTAGCVQFVGPARTASSYEHKAANTAEAVLSAARLASIAADGATDDRLLAPYVAVVLSEAERDAAGAIATFDGIQPPSEASDDLRTELGALLADVSDVLADLRIAARRGELADLADAAAPIDDLAGELEAFIEDHG